MSSFKYEKPMARTLGSLSAAEGGCTPGFGATGTTCSTGTAQAGVCGSGGTAASKRNLGLCLTGPQAANCAPGSSAGG